MDACDSATSAHATHDRAVMCTLRVAFTRCALRSTKQSYSGHSFQCSTSSDTYHGDKVAIVIIDHVRWYHRWFNYLFAPHVMILELNWIRAYLYASIAFVDAKHETVQ